MPRFERMILALGLAVMTPGGVLSQEPWSDVTFHPRTPHGFTSGDVRPCDRAHLLRAYRRTRSVMAILKDCIDAHPEGEVGWDTYLQLDRLLDEVAFHRPDIDPCTLCNQVGAIYLEVLKILHQRPCHDLPSLRIRRSHDPRMDAPTKDAPTKDAPTKDAPAKREPPTRSEAPAIGEKTLTKPGPRRPGVPPLPEGPSPDREVPCCPSTPIREL